VNLPLPLSTADHRRRRRLVADLKRRIEAGRYVVDAVDVAEAVLRFHREGRR
jgi:anti-sigma28 factor (negative regulator of flagellin synthesis)